MTDRKYAVQYQVGDEMCTRPCSTLGTAVMVRNHMTATDHPSAMLVEVVDLTVRMVGTFDWVTGAFTDFTGFPAGTTLEIPAPEIIARSGSFSVAVDHDFITSMTRDDLRAKAKDLGIAGRGAMDKGQLRAAVLQAYGYSS